MLVVPVGLDVLVVVAAAVFDLVSNAVVVVVCCCRPCFMYYCFAYGASLLLPLLLF